MPQHSFDIVRLDPEQATAAIASLADLLVDAVESGGSVGFLAPLARATAEAHWRQRIVDLQQGARLILAARDGEEIVGSVQLAYAYQQNAAHRAEVQRLMVLRNARRRGIGRALMLDLEVAARELGRTLLVLNTRSGDPPETLYRRLGYNLVGTIPDYARNPDGTLNTTSIMYRQL